MSLWTEKPQCFPESSFKTSEQLKALVPKHETPRNEDQRSTNQSTYHMLCCLCMIANMTVAGCMVIGRDMISLERLRRNSTIALSANFCACIAIRNEHIINTIIRIACSLPHRTPLSIRTAAAQVYCHGGIHSGCAVSGAMWYLMFTCLCFLGSQQTPGLRMALSFLSGIAMLLLTTILIFAHPSLRAKHHNVFELTHGLLGWTFLDTLWLQVILTALADSIDNTRMLGHHLLTNAPFWVLVMSTVLLIYPWTRLRLVSVEAINVSNHVLCLTVDHRGKGSCMTRRLATVPLKETHAFATIPGKDNVTYSIYTSAAGDWTRGLIGDPPKKIWIKGCPTYGATHSSKLFRKVLFVATWSGIAPVLSAIFCRPVSEVVVLWITSNPHKKLDLKQLQELEAYRDNVIICNTGRGEIMPGEVAAISHELNCKHHVFGPIFDS